MVKHGRCSVVLVGVLLCLGGQPLVASESPADLRPDAGDEQAGLPVSPAERQKADHLEQLRRLVSQTLVAGYAGGAGSQELTLRWNALQQAGLSMWAKANSLAQRDAVQRLMYRVGLLPMTPVWNPSHDQASLVPAQFPNLAPVTPLPPNAAVLRPTLVHFWALWCAPCRREMPELEHFYQNEYLALADAGLQLLTVNLDPILPAPVSPLPVQHDPGFALYRRLSGEQAVALPATFLVMPDGQYHALAYGPLQWQADLLLPKVQRRLAAGVAEP